MVKITNLYSLTENLNSVPMWLKIDYKVQLHEDRTPLASEGTCTHKYIHTDTYAKLKISKIKIIASGEW